MQPDGAARPRFRQDLVAEPIDDDGKRFIDVMDPDSGSTFRFFDVEYSIACAMDGQRDVTGLVQWAKEELGLAPSATEVQGVIATLGELGYLDGKAATAVSPAAAAPTQPLSGPATAPASPAAITAKPAPVETFIGTGVVVGPKPVHTPVPGLELGHAGATSPATPSPPAAAPFDLAPGVTSASKPTRAPTPIDHADVALGASGKSDMSTDLSDSVGIGVEDVKEAVRASQVMKAVDVSPELAAMLSSDDMKPAPAPAPAPTPVARQPEPIAVKPAPAPAPVAVATASRRPEPAKPAIATAAQPPRPAAAPPAPETRTSRTLIGLLVVVILGGAAFFVYRYVMKSGEPAADPAPPQHTKVEPPPAPPAPAVETVKLATLTERTQGLVPQVAGTVDTVSSSGSVAAGAIVATLVGAKPIETEIDSIKKDIEKRVQVELDQAQKDQAAAQAAGNKAGEQAAASRISDRRKSLTDKQTKIAALAADMSKLQIRAPFAGTITAGKKAGDKVAVTDAVVTLTHSAARTATFTRAPKSGAVGYQATLATTDGKQLTCTITALDTTALAVECPTDAAPEGTPVTLSSVQTDADIVLGSDAPPAANGSAAGSAAPALAQPAPPAPVAAPKKAFAHAAPPPAPAPSPGSAATTPTTVGSATGSAS